MNLWNVLFNLPNYTESSVPAAAFWQRNNIFFQMNANDPLYTALFSNLTQSTSLANAFLLYDEQTEDHSQRNVDVYGVFNHLGDQTFQSFALVSVSENSASYKQFTKNSRYYVTHVLVSVILILSLGIIFYFIIMRIIKKLHFHMQDLLIKIQYIKEGATDINVKDKYNSKNQSPTFSSLLRTAAGSPARPQHPCSSPILPARKHAPP